MESNLTDHVWDLVERLEELFLKIEGVQHLNSVLADPALDDSTLGSKPKPNLDELLV